MCVDKQQNLTNLYQLSCKVGRRFASEEGQTFDSACCQDAKCGASVHYIIARNKMFSLKCTVVTRCCEFGLLKKIYKEHESKLF